MRYVVNKKRQKRHFFSNEFDFLFNELLNNTRPKRFVQKNPSVNVIEEKEVFKLEVAIPGVSKEDVSLKVEEDTLIISAQNDKEKAEDSTVAYTLKEFDYSNFVRRFQLNEKIDKDAISAGFSNGVLSVVLPKVKEEEKISNRTIEIN